MSLNDATHWADFPSRVHLPDRGYGPEILLQAIFLVGTIIFMLQLVSQNDFIGLQF